MQSKMKKWELNNDISPLAPILEDELKIPLVFANILAQRGISNFEEAKQFFRPSFSDLLDPFSMLGMKKAVDRVIQAKQENQKVLVYGDYDVDGTCSVSLMYLFLKEIEIDVSFYQPDRYKEGYGVSMQSVEWAKKNNIDLIIALDCGVKAIEQANEFKKYGIDLIICDHHLPGNILPFSVAMLNPKQENCSYPFKDLCGCGIGFKLIHAISIELKLDSDIILEYLDLVAIATAADIVPMVGENRVLVKLGLQKINETPRIGVKSLIEFSKRKGLIESSDLVFAISPRINAAGRLGHASMAVELLSSKTSKEVQKWAQLIEDLNMERREIDKKTTEEALILLADDKDKFTSVVCSDNWHKGVVGIVASRLIETYYRPTVVLCNDGDFITGSVRSVKGFDVHAVLVNIGDVFERFGGHKYAAGVTLLPEKLEEFKRRFENEVKALITDDLLVEKIKIDAELIPMDLVRDKKSTPFPKLFRLVDQLAPFGPGNMRPVFKIKNMINAGYTKVVGETHLKINVKQDGGNITLDGIGFGLGHLKYLLTNNKLGVDIAFSLEKNEYNGNVKIQLRVRDMKHSI